MADESSPGVPPGPHPPPPPPVAEAGAGLGEYLGAEDTVHGEPRGCGLTLVSIPLLAAGIGLVVARISVPLTVLGAILILVAAGIVTYGWRHPGRPHPVLYCYQRGAVRYRPDAGPPQVHAWPDLIPYEWTEYVSVGQAANQHAIHRLQLRTPGGEVVAAFTQDAAVRVSERVARTQLVEAEEVLARGGELRYGAFRLTRRDLTVNDQVRPWSAVRAVRAEGTELLVYGPGRRRALTRVDRRSTPHEHTLLTLVARRLAGNQRPPV